MIFINLLKEECDCDSNGSKVQGKATIAVGYRHPAGMCGFVTSSSLTADDLVSLKAAFRRSIPWKSSDGRTSILGGERISIEIANPGSEAFKNTMTTYRTRQFKKELKELVEDINEER